ncbi:TPA: hypothetical protein ACH3X3_009162 [Trebouxia sp. C0006]
MKTMMPAMKTHEPLLHPQRITHFGLGPARRPDRHHGSRSLHTSESYQAAPDNLHRTSDDAKFAQQHARLDVLAAPDGNVSDEVATAFRWPGAFGSHAVSILGSFNSWQEPIPLHQSADTGDWFVSMMQSPGLHQYKFLVDDVWQTSPCEPIVSDSQGSYNNQQSVACNITFDWIGDGLAREVFVAGDFTGWMDLLPLSREAGSNKFSLDCSLLPGAYFYQFLVDGQWSVSGNSTVEPDEQGHLSNKVIVHAPPAFHLFYGEPGWQGASIHMRLTCKQHTQGWQQVALHNTASRSQHWGGGRWKTAVVPLPKGCQSTQMELAIKSNTDEGQGPSESSHYMCPHPGGYKIQHGQLRPFPQATAGPIMLVSDLDGTMVGNGHEADAMTHNFKQYWEDNAALRNSVLVYNTGRSLGQFTSLYQEKAGALALPNVLITAVGTKIFLLDMEGGCREQASGQKWHQDLQWSHRLDEGWDLSAVKQVAEEAVQRHANDSTVNWLDHGTEHPHRIALSVHTSSLQDCLTHLRHGFQHHDVQVRIIVSGVGDYRYVDCVAIKAGKQEALEYIRALFNIPLTHCMAAGDSGNDILMLEGQHQAIIVSNAQQELLDWLLQQKQTPRIVCTNAPMADGILEGIARHGLH